MLVSELINKLHILIDEEIISSEAKVRVWNRDSELTYLNLNEKQYEVFRADRFNLIFDEEVNNGKN